MTHGLSKRDVIIIDMGPPCGMGVGFVYASPNPPATVFLTSNPFLEVPVSMQYPFRYACFLHEPVHDFSPHLVEAFENVRRSSGVIDPMHPAMFDLYNRGVRCIIAPLPFDARVYL